MPRLDAKIPWYFDLARGRIVSGKHGGFLLARLFRGLGLFDRYCLFPLGDGESIYLSLKMAGLLDTDLLSVYERGAIEAMATAIEHMPEPPIFIDGGADTGLYARLLLGRTKRVSRLIVIEPNPETFEVLRMNLRSIEGPKELRNVALSYARGRGRLCTPDYDRSNSAKFIERTADGEVEVLTVDDLLPSSRECVALKIDVEGAELDVLKGAAGLISRAPAIAIQLEANRSVAKRTGLDPIECLRFISEMREMRWAVFHEATASRYGDISLQRGFFEQLPAAPFYDVVGTGAELGHHV